MTAIKFLHELQERRWLPQLPGGPTSKSDCRRWLDQGAVEINGEIVKWNTELEFRAPGGYLEELVFFPNNPKRKTTMWHWKYA